MRAGDGVTVSFLTKQYIMRPGDGVMISFF